MPPTSHLVSCQTRPVELSRRDLFGVAASMVFLAACSSSESAATTSSIDDDPVLRAGSATADASTVAPGPAPAVTAPSSPAPVSVELPPSTVPLTTAQLPSGAEPVPEEGRESYVQIGTMQIPAIGIDAPLGEGVTLTNLNKGPGHWPGTALPGALGNAVIGGHRVSHTHPFRDLDKLVTGDVVTMTVATGQFAYAVTATEIVLPTEVRVLDQTDAFTATLFACTPKGQTTHRIIVHLTMTQPST